ncbi:MAG: hypothetical protein ACLS2V_12600 [Clostridium paraputrificum]|nr:hypothetical protein [Clostridium sp.]MBS5926159.1 hypothetical protein [Clostridium sp.]
MEIILKYKNKGEDQVIEMKFSDYYLFGFWMAQNCEEIEIIECVEESDL